ncbi:MAG: aldo/keto reductase [Nitrospirae bacterium]|nr:aldo/keto reductase [Nitrospirota bacterium]
MGIEGYATVEGTRRYRDRMVAAGTAHEEHFRGGLGGLALSSIGLGTYLGGHDARTDSLYLEAVKQAVAAGCNVFDSAINYRCQRSERVIGQALSELVRDGVVRRDEVLIATKGGFIPYDGAPPRDTYAYLQQTFVMPGIIKTTDVVADCHCMTPAYLRHQLDASLTNLGLACLDVYYLHNPETQLDAVSRDEFMTRVRAAFETLEQAVAEGKLRCYGTATWNGYRSRPGSGGHLSLEALVNVAKDMGGKDHHFKVIQLPYNLGMPEALTQQTQTLNGSAVSLLEAAKVLDVYVMSSASILQGQLSRGLPSGVTEVLGDGTDAQRSIQFVRSTPGMGTALVGMKQAAHVRDNLAVARRAPLTPGQFTTLFK